MITYRAAVPGDFEDIRQFLSAAGWTKRAADADRFHRMLANADRTVLALDGRTVVGFVRALCDGASNGYIGTLAVAKPYRRQGIGRELVHRVMGTDADVTWMLRASHGSEAFWKALGFVPSSVAMERTRRG